MLNDGNTAWWSGSAGQSALATERPLTASDERPTADPGSDYHPRLIDRLVLEHTRLASLLQSIAAAAREKDLCLQQSELVAFATELHNHFQVENARLLVYLQRGLAFWPHLDSRIEMFTTNLRGIAAAINAFLDRYLCEDKWDEECSKVFLIELAIVQDLMKDWMKEEEANLYPLYVPQPALQQTV